MRALDWQAMIDKQPGPLRSKCWLWTGAVNEQGRPAWGGRHAHRRVYELVKGTVPPVLHHRCRNPMCVNPGHMKGYASNSEHLAAEKHVEGRFVKGQKPWSTGKVLIDGPYIMAGGRRRRLIEIVCETCGRTALVGQHHRPAKFCSVPCALVNARAKRKKGRD